MALLLAVAVPGISAVAYIVTARFQSLRLPRPQARVCFAYDAASTLIRTSKLECAKLYAAGTVGLAPRMVACK